MKHCRLSKTCAISHPELTYICGGRYIWTSGHVIIYLILLAHCALLLEQI